MRKINTFFKKINTNVLVASSAFIVSVCALFISVQEVRIMRTQQKATMYPYITIGWTYNGQGFGMELTNSGNGLAKVNSYKVFNDSIYFREWLDVLTTYMPEATTIGYGNITTSGNIRNLMISPGETKTLIFVKWNEESRILQPRLDDIQISICYESLLGDHWEVVNGIPQEVTEPCEILMEQEFGF
jgi:hypothetical protein